MSESADLRPPSLLAYGIAHIAVGLVVGAVTEKIFRQKRKIAAAAAIMAIGLHYNFDVPLARKLDVLMVRIRASDTPFI